MSGSVAQFQPRRAYSESNTRAHVLEWAFAGGTLSVVAAYSMYGFVAWRFFLNNVNQHSTSFFLEQPLLLEDNVTLVDNASVHKAPGTLTVLDQVTRGKYVFVVKRSS